LKYRGISPIRIYFPVFFMLFLIGLDGCTLFATRPIQEMSFTAAAIRAAKEVSADTLAPELFRQSGEWFFKAKHEYKFKNFHLAKEYAKKARYFAEQAEFESLRNGGIRSEQGGGIDPMAKDPLAGAAAGSSGAGDGSGGANAADPKAQATPYPYPTPTGIPAESYGTKDQGTTTGAAPQGGGGTTTPTTK